jgi:RsiW-degrading membrane proteinase PrsW (M82 family)
MAPESLPVQSTPMSEPMAPPVVVTSKKSKMTLYLIIAIVVVVLATAGYFVYKNFI